MKKLIPKDWYALIKEEISQDYFKDLEVFIEHEYKNKIIFPEEKNIFRALSFFKPNETKVVIIGQDPYHTPGVADGLAFSTQSKKIPPSLRNIYKEIESDLSIKKDFNNSNLEHWSKQGVLLLNSIMTVESGLAASHRKKGWEKFTKALLEKLADQEKNIVFVAWGSFAQKLIKDINRSDHLIIEGTHPSPLSAYRGFFGSKVFSKINSYLTQENKKTITW